MAKKQKNKRMRKRRWFTATERVEVWDRWQRGGVVPNRSDACWTEGDRRFIVNGRVRGHPSAVPLPVHRGH